MPWESYQKPKPATALNNCQTRIKLFSERWSSVRLEDPRAPPKRNYERQTSGRRVMQLSSGQITCVIENMLLKLSRCYFKVTVLFFHVVTIIGNFLLSHSDHMLIFCSKIGHPDSVHHTW
ncbi:hypothetical protein CEXT_246961 [Caerostris extrusa]|uniref:Uncharacterized protein n=1 Tax=Caerostris extrusa TaxID=172846 RepID=A0AAV4NAY4_CAEEX|nr:hypothetical protein CEXT_246961 [Caerostris extrusa]